MRHVAVALHSRLFSRKVLCAIVDMRAGSPEALRSLGAGTLRHAPVWTWRLRYAAVALHSVICCFTSQDSNAVFTCVQVRQRPVVDTQLGRVVPIP
jgi:hypothetical protein